MCAKIKLKEIVIIFTETHTHTHKIVRHACSFEALLVYCDLNEGFDTLKGAKVNFEIQNRMFKQLNDLIIISIKDFVFDCVFFF